MCLTNAFVPDQFSITSNGASGPLPTAIAQFLGALPEVVERPENLLQNTTPPGEGNQLYAGSSGLGGQHEKRRWSAAVDDARRMELTAGVAIQDKKWHNLAQKMMWLGCEVHQLNTGVN